MMTAASAQADDRCEGVRDREGTGETKREREREVGKRKRKRIASGRGPAASAAAATAIRIICKLIINLPSPKSRGGERGAGEETA